MKFTEFSLHESLLQGIEGAGYVDCTPVQEQVLKSSLEGRDLYVQSQTGTGKTAAYLTSVIQELLTRGESAGKKALVMVPTRELAVQVQEEAQKLAKFTSLKCASFYGGVGYDKQVASLKKGVDIMIGTPGRVIDLNHGNQMDLSSVAFLVIDEADRMFDMGFYPDLRTLIKVLPSSEQRQTMLFSATLNSYVKNLAWEYTRNPAEITIAAENITVDEIAQELFHVSSDDKMKLLLGIISHEKPESLIVFCNTKKSCEIVAKRLKMNGFESEFIIGDLPQKKRLTIMDKFKAGAIKCLVATDVAARGIDVNDLAMVINYDLPNEAENYVHRIGRTARAGKSGKAFTFCSEQDVYSLPPIERYIEKSIPSCVADESMFAEDKSAGVYIKLDSYHEDYNDKSEFGRRRAAEYNRKNGNSDRRRSSKKGSGRYSSRNEEAKKEYKRDRRVYIDEDKLASMSTEERMKIYKEKYASFASGSSYNKQKISTKKQGVAKKNSSVQKNASGKKNYSSKSAESKKTSQKKSVFARIKSFFGKK
ncbi:DEAD/DEAH box helicase [Treponema succinifaciens]|uniref:DEAD/DEAH box helicase domain protein n=1 Tax=Treponema succinifaciens (strain ATCC 33096 / DSM 2489 / 6091) TaxID=869209 RepID=F2NY86_TRES6|nr:DEAD/DEAH box helicase [Treponema succinifaciens]AEB14107.1 DEAD/DEAH box helicase domain protein [Treponema succinifaciens DSM 2489]